MAVTEVGTATLGSDLVGGTNFTIARTVTSGSKGLTVQLTYYNGSGSVAPPTLSWNTSETMTQVAVGANAGGDYRSTIYFLANPTAGSFNVTGTFSGTAFWRAAVREWSNSNSTHGGAGADGDSAAPSVNVTSVVSGEVILDALIQGSNAAATAGSGQSTANLYNANIVGSQWGAASTDTTSTGTVAMDWTITSAVWVIAAIALVEAASGSRAMFRGG